MLKLQIIRKHTPYERFIKKAISVPVFTGMRAFYKTPLRTKSSFSVEAEYVLYPHEGVIYSAPTPGPYVVNGRFFITLSERNPQRKVVRIQTGVIYERLGNVLVTVFHP